MKVAIFFVLFIFATFWLSVTLAANGWGGPNRKG